MQPRLHPINPKPRGHFRSALKGTICLGLNRIPPEGCVSLAIMSPLTAKVKCPHYGRQSEFEAEAVEKVASSQNGIGGASLFERGKSTDAG
jgi:hypothetical protein